MKYCSFLISFVFKIDNVLFSFRIDLILKDFFKLLSWFYSKNRTKQNYANKEMYFEE